MDPETATPTEQIRRWRRRLAIGYWALSPLLFPILVRILLAPDMAVASLLDPLPGWFKWLAVPYLIVVVGCAAGFLWFLWTRVRELPPPIGS